MDDIRAMIDNMFLLFEGIGNNCEFGIVQRHFRCDPPGLFRNVGFLAPDIMSLIIEKSLDGLFDNGSYEFTLPDGWRDWRLDSQGFMFHTGIPASVVLGSDEWEKKSAEVLRAHGFLRRVFREELLKADKIFVYRQKQPLPIEALQRLHSAIRRHGPGWLLNVVEDPSKPAGTVEQIGDGLIRATTSVLSNEDPPNINFEAWEMIVRKALTIKESAGGDVI